MHPLIQSERSHSSLSARQARKDSGGFVLVAVLLLVALATVLIVTTSGITQIERKAVSNSAKEELARQNALFALQNALAQLQSSAGPDQRVTATADILNTNSLPLTNSPVFQPFWTGVWKSFNPAWTNTASPWFRPQPLDTDTNGTAGTTTTALRPWSTGGGATNSNMVWLVSGATNNSLINPLTSTTNWITNSILLASNWGTNQLPVIVPAVNLSYNGTNNGRYAYWVSDEGVKAKVALADTNMTSATASTPGMWVAGLTHFTAPATFYALPSLTNLVSATNDFRTNPASTYLSHLNELQFLDTNYASLTNNTLAGDYTVWSYGVLSDTRNGGLRQDLTAAFESATNCSQTNFYTLQARSGSGSNNDACCLFSATNVAISPAANFTYFSNALAFVLDSKASTLLAGPRWISLYSYYNLYKATMPTNPTVSTVLAGLSSPSGVGGTKTPASVLGASPNAFTSSGYNTLEARSMNFYESNTTPSNSDVFTVLPIAPTQIADRIDTALTVYSYTTNVGTGTNPTNVTMYNFQVQYYPLIAIHNPYSMALTISNTVNYALTKNALANAGVMLTCSNPATNAFETNNSSWLYLVTNGSYVTNSSAGGLQTNLTYATNTNTYTGTNLFPIAISTYSFGTNATAANNYNYFPLIQGTPGGYPMNQQITNITTLMPGEVRLFVLSNTTGPMNITNCPNMTNLISASVVSLDSYQSCRSSWAGTTNRNDTVYLGITNLAVGTYNSARWYPNASINQWPDSSGSGFGSATPVVLVPAGSGSATMSANPLSLGAIGYMYNNATTIRILGCYERLKGIYSDSDTNYINSSTFLPMMMGNSIMLDAGRSGGFNGFSGTSGKTTEVYAQAGVTNTSVSSLISDSVVNTNLVSQWGALSLGSTNTSISNIQNPSRLVLRDIPVAPLTSLGQLQHFEDYNFNRAYISYSFPPQSIGGGFAGPDVCTNTTTMAYTFSSTNNSSLNYDYSYMANEALFDTYYFSTIPPTNGFKWDGTNGYGAFTNISLTAANIATNAPLPDTRYVYYRKNGSNPLVTDLQDESKAAANLLINGAFNVNSTSIPAWKALLAGLQGQTFHTYNYITGTSQDIPPSSLPSGYPYPIPRFWSVSYTNTANVPWEGLRALNDTQLTALATEIVKQVRLRGPFLSMGDFLNRRLGATLNQTNSLGTIQAAIENTATNGSTQDVNSCIHAVFNQTPSTNYVMTNIVSNTAASIPGYLIQCDIMQAFAPVMAPRSDTFVIRVYGEADKSSTNLIATNYSSLPNGVTGQAWGEAVVQRTPEYLDQTDPQLTSTSFIPGVSYALGDATPPIFKASVINSNNQNFGRRFKIVSFRWLNPNEL